MPGERLGVADAHGRVRQVFNLCYSIQEHHFWSCGNCMEPGIAWAWSMRMEGCGMCETSVIVPRNIMFVSFSKVFVHIRSYTYMTLRATFSSRLIISAKLTYVL